MFIQGGTGIHSLIWINLSVYYADLQFYRTASHSLKLRMFLEHDVFHSLKPTVGEKA